VNGNPVNFTDPQGLEAFNNSNTNEATQNISYVNPNGNSGFNSGSQSLTLIAACGAECGVVSTISDVANGWLTEAATSTAISAASMAAAGAVILPQVLASDSTNRPEYLYATYTRTNPITGLIYSGRTSGYGNPNDLVQARGMQQTLLNAEGFAKPVLDSFSTNYNAIRGREQQLIDFNGGARSVGGTTRNIINGVSDLNPLRPYYIYESTKSFGPLPDNSPSRFKLGN
jgi:hypothetical protein